MSRRKEATNAGRPISEHGSPFELQTCRNIVHLAQPIKNILTAKHRAAWRLISLLARSLFRLLNQSQAP